MQRSKVNLLSLTILLSFLLLLLTFLSGCKKENFDPHKYDYLLYKAPPPPNYNFDTISLNLDGIFWHTTGTAYVDSNSLKIEGIAGTQKINFILADFKTKSSFHLNPGSSDSCLIFKGTDRYSSGNTSSSGNFNILHLDTLHKLIEANYDGTFYNSNGQQIKATNGYIKISYTENYMMARVNFKSWLADSLWITLNTNNTPDATDDRYTVTGRDTTGGKSTDIQLVFPAQFVMGTYTLSNKPNALYTAYYVSNNTPDQCSSDIQNKIHLSNDASTQTIHGTFYFQSDIDANLIEQGKFTISYKDLTK